MTGLHIIKTIAAPQKVEERITGYPIFIEDNLFR